MVGLGQNTKVSSSCLPRDMVKQNTRTNKNKHYTTLLLSQYINNFNISEYLAWVVIKKYQASELLIIQQVI